MAVLDQLLSIVEKVTPKVEESPGDRLPINDKVLLVKMPAPRTKVC